MFDACLRQDIHSAQLEAVEQQHENMRYIRALNECLGRDVRDRQTEIQGIAESFNQLRDYFYQLGLGSGQIDPSLTYPGL